MKVFVTGATGVLGRATVTQLRGDGVEVRALCRSIANRTQLRQLDAVEADLFDPTLMAAAMEGCEAVLHLATRIPRLAQMRRSSAWAENDRIRSDGTTSIAGAARRTTSVKTIVYPSVAFAYADNGSEWIEAGTAKLEPTGPLKSTLNAESEVQQFASESSGRRGIVLRFGAFYGPASLDSRQTLDMARKGFVMPIAPKEAYKSMIWIGDAASALVAAFRSAGSGVYDVVEDHPSTQADSYEALAHAAGRKALTVLPRWLLRFALSADLRRIAARSQRVSNQAFKEVSGWVPAVPDQRTGWALMAGQPAEIEADGLIAAAE